MARAPGATVVPDIADTVVTQIDVDERLSAAHAALGRLRRTGAGADGGERVAPVGATEEALDREIFMLCVCSGLTYAQVAQALDLPVGTVRVACGVAVLVVYRPRHRPRPTRLDPGQLRTPHGRRKALIGITLGHAHGPTLVRDRVRVRSRHPTHGSAKPLRPRVS
ncbi:RNA polymerase sigma factor [Embleya sp. NPDC008237]|uniref:RNA polymerase sigma factor n=1 Tax=Embleya sp. NPDC008237 TaxID=3363978 RepID=UPI0036F142A5